MQSLVIFCLSLLLATGCAKKFNEQLLNSSELRLPTEELSFEDYNIYIKVDGTGVGTVDDPVGSLYDAKEAARNLNTRGDITFHIHPGTYLNQYLVWDLPMIKDQVITFRPWVGKPGWPTFNGKGLGDQDFFSFAKEEPTNTRFRFWHLKIENYLNGISLRGNISEITAFNSGNEIVNCRFENIGDKHSPESTSIGYGAIRLFNSRYNKILFNQFLNIENTTELSSIHGVYLVWYAQSNQISHNYFSMNSGDPIRTRDSSSYNIITRNLFWRSGAVAIAGDWYCNAEKVSNCRTPEKIELIKRLECPSFDSSFKFNRLSSTGYLETSTIEPTKAVRLETAPDYSNIEGFGKYLCPQNAGLRFLSDNNAEASLETLEYTLRGWENSGGVIDKWQIENQIESEFN